MKTYVIVYSTFTPSNAQIHELDLNPFVRVYVTNSQHKFIGVENKSSELIEYDRKEIIIVHWKINTINDISCGQSIMKYNLECVKPTNI